jgi:hypothetical protein
MLMVPAPTVSAQAGNPGQVIDLHSGAWRTEPRRPGAGQAKARAACCSYCCPDCTRLDRWVNGMGGYVSTRFIALCNEAREMAGISGQWRYLEMAQAADEEHAATADGHLAAELELANARSARAASRRGEDEAAALLQRVDEIQLAAGRLSEHPRLAADPHFGSGPGPVRC